MANASLHQSLSQQQTLAPQMRKSLEILQAGTLELSQLVQQALETNPVLEDLTETISLDDEGPDAEEADSLDYMNQTDDDWRDRTILEGKSSPWTSEDEERRQRVYDSIVAPETLQQHLQHQLDLSMVDPEIREAAQAILGNLDDRGFLDLPAKTLGMRMGLKQRDIEEALKLVQSFDPAGIGASGIPESLLLQLERTTGKETIEYKIVRDHLEDLARKRHPQIARALGTTVERIAEAASRIGRLTPNPGGEFDPTGNPYILPDAVIERDDDGNWYARLTGEHLPNLRINDFYKDMIGKTGTDAKARQFLRDQIRDGRSLIHAISLRQETILAIRQRDRPLVRVFSCHFFPAPVVLPHEQKDAMAGRAAKIRRETGVLPRDFPRRGPAFCFRDRGEGEIPGADAAPGEIHGLSSDFLLFDGQPLSYSLGSAANGGRRAIR